MLEVGDTAPELVLPDAAGVEHRLADHRGSWVVVSFYPADDTPGCTKQACSVRDHWGELSDAGIAVLSISPDDAASHEAFAEKHDLPHTLLCDPEKTVMTRWGAWGEKVLYGRQTTGVIRSTVWIGPDGKVVKHWQRVPKAADHPAKVREALEAGV